MSEQKAGREEISKTELSEGIAEVVLKVPGVSGLSSTLSDSIQYIPGVHSRVKGVHVAEDEGTIKVDLFILAAYGSNIPQTAWDIQTEVHDYLKSRGFKSLGDIDIHVQGVSPGEDSI